MRWGCEMLSRLKEKARFSRSVAPVHMGFEMPNLLPDKHASHLIREVLSFAQPLARGSGGVTEANSHTKLAMSHCGHKRPARDEMSRPIRKLIAPFLDRRASRGGSNHARSRVVLQTV